MGSKSSIPNSKEAQKYTKLIEKFMSIESDLSDFELYNILNCNKFHSNNFCDLLCHFCFNFHTLQCPESTKNFFEKIIGKKFIEFISSSEFFREKSKEEKAFEEKEEKEHKERILKERAKESGETNNKTPGKIEDYKTEEQRKLEEDKLETSTICKHHSRFDLAKFKLVLFLFTSDTFFKKEEIYNDKVKKLQYFFLFIFYFFFSFNP